MCPSCEASGPQVQSWKVEVYWEGIDDTSEKAMTQKTPTRTTLISHTPEVRIEGLVQTGQQDSVVTRRGRQVVRPHYLKDTRLHFEILLRESYRILWKKRRKNRKKRSIMFMHNCWMYNHYLFEKECVKHSYMLQKGSTFHRLFYLCTLFCTIFECCFLNTN